MGRALSLWPRNDRVPRNCAATKARAARLKAPSSSYLACCRLPSFFLSFFFIFFLVGRTRARARPGLFAISGLLRSLVPHSLFIHIYVYKTNQRIRDISERQMRLLAACSIYLSFARIYERHVGARSLLVISAVSAAILRKERKKKMARLESIFLPLGCLFPSFLGGLDSKSFCPK